LVRKRFIGSIPIVGSSFYGPGPEEVI